MIFLLACAFTFARPVAAQSPVMNGCAVGSNIPYPTPVLYGTNVNLPATSYLDYMSCSFILNLQSTPPAFDSTLTFSKFQTELNYDFVEVYNGCDPLFPSQRNSSIAPCSLISDFPFQIMRKSGVFRFVVLPFPGAPSPATPTYGFQVPSRRLRHTLYPHILHINGLDSLSFRYFCPFEWLQCYSGTQELGRLRPFPQPP